MQEAQQVWVMLVLSWKRQKLFSRRMDPLQRHNSVTLSLELLLTGQLLPFSPGTTNTRVCKSWLKNHRNVHSPVSAGVFIFVEVFGGSLRLQSRRRVTSDGSFQLSQQRLRTPSTPRCCSSQKKSREKKPRMEFKTHGFTVKVAGLNQ